MYLKTAAAADQLGISYYQLFGLLRFRKIKPPARDSSGDYVWTPGDVKRARHALDRRQRREVAGHVCR